MGDPIGDLIARVHAIGGSLAVTEGGLEYVGPLEPLAPELRQEIRTNKAALIERVTPPSIATLLARLADQGFSIALDDRGPILDPAEGTDPESADPALVAEVNARIHEVIDFLRKDETELTDEELDALGYRRRYPGARILADGEDEEPAWEPPPGWGLDAGSAAPKGRSP